MDKFIWFVTGYLFVNQQCQFNSIVCAESESAAKCIVFAELIAESNMGYSPDADLHFAVEKLGVVSSDVDRNIQRGIVHYTRIS